MWAGVRRPGQPAAARAAMMVRPEGMPVGSGASVLRHGGRGTGALALRSARGLATGTENSSSVPPAAPPPETPSVPVVMVQAGPYEFNVTKGQKYSWCTCGRSAKQPLCDGAHKGTGHKPLRMVADEDATLYLCGCKHTSTPPYCDGTHVKYA